MRSICHDVQPTSNNAARHLSARAYAAGESLQSCVRRNPLPSSNRRSIPVGRYTATQATGARPCKRARGRTAPRFPFGRASRRDATTVHVVLLRSIRACATPVKRARAQRPGRAARIDTRVRIGQRRDGLVGLRNTGAARREDQTRALTMRLRSAASGFFAFNKSAPQAQSHNFLSLSARIPAPLLLFSGKT